MGKLATYWAQFVGILPTRTGDPNPNIVKFTRTAEPAVQEWKEIKPFLREGEIVCIPTIFAVYPQVRLVVHKQAKDSLKRKGVFYYFVVQKKVAEAKKWQTVATGAKRARSLADCLEEAKLVCQLQYQQIPDYELVDHTKKD